MKFIDLFAGLGGFHLALKNLGHECVFASEIDDELREIYVHNFPDMDGKVFGDIREFRDQVPAHDILCGGFPCQPFSKSGSQLGLHDKIRGTLFDEIVYILEARHPAYVLLENVGNFERHDNGRTWQIVKEKLIALGYDVRGTEHFASGGTGLISPQYLGFPQSRERFFIVAQLNKLPDDPFPFIDRKRATSLYDIIQTKNDLTALDKLETRPSQKQIDCINHWGEFIAKLPDSTIIPSFPIWGDEINATYPYESHTPYKALLDELQIHLDEIPSDLKLKNMLSQLPSYAKTETVKFPAWKVDFIKKNRDWFNANAEFIYPDWINKLCTFPPSLRKLEWNCKGEDRDIWKYVLQFRPSGLRVKRMTSAPALVAMTSTQIPLLGPEKRFLTRTEGLRLQGFPDNHKLPIHRDKAFKALGNAVHTDVAQAIASKLADKSNVGQGFSDVIDTTNLYVYSKS